MCRGEWRTIIALWLLPVDPGLDKVLGRLGLPFHAQHFDKTDLQGIAILDAVLDSAFKRLAKIEERRGLEDEERRGLEAEEGARKHSNQRGEAGGQQEAAKDGDSSH